jgi:hypothetical protein
MRERYDGHGEAGGAGDAVFGCRTGRLEGGRGAEREALITCCIAAAGCSGAVGRADGLRDVIGAVDNYI